MNDDELPMRAETASAYLDGELAAAERIAAASDADTMALVDSFAQVRAALADVAPVDDDTRSSAIAAALAEFDGQRSTAPIAAAVATVTPLQQRRMRSYRLVTGVAAALVIGVVAVAVINSTGDDSKSSSANEAVVPLGAETADSAQTPALKVSDTEAAAGATEAAATPAAATPTAGGSSSGSSATTVPEVDNPAELAQYATDLSGETSTTTASPAATEHPTTAVAASSTATPQVAPSPASATAYQPPACVPSYDTVLGPISVKGTAAFAVRDTSAGMLRAIDAVDCQVLFSVAAP